MSGEHRDVIVPYICVKGAEEAIAFYSSVFEAVEVARYQEGDGPIGHATLNLHGAELFLSDEFPEIGVLSPTTIGGAGFAMHIAVANVDEVTKTAVEYGAELLRAPADQAYGERNAKFRDPFGHVWMVASR